MCIQIDIHVLATIKLNFYMTNNNSACLDCLFSLTNVSSQPGLIFRKLAKNLDFWPKLDKNVGFNEKKRKNCYFFSPFGYKWPKTNKKVTKNWPTTYNPLFCMIFFHFFIFINLVTVTDRGVKVGQDDQKLVKMTNLTITPPQSRGLRGSPAYNSKSYPLKLANLTS